MTAAAEADADGVVSAPKRAPKTFAQTLQEVSFGDAAEEATKKLTEALEAAQRLGKSASITVQLTFRPLKNGQVEVYPLITNKVPKEELGAHIMFFGETGVQTQDPRQRNLEGIRAVAEERPAAARSVEAEEPRVLRTA